MYCAEHGCSLAIASPCTYGVNWTLSFVLAQGGLVVLGMALAVLPSAMLEKRWADSWFLILYFSALYFPSLAATTRLGAAHVTSIYAASHCAASGLDLLVGWGWLTLAKPVCAIQEARTEIPFELLCSLSGQVRFISGITAASADSL